MKKKKKLLWVSEVCINTGFARVTESLLKFLSECYEVTILDTYRAHREVLRYENYTMIGRKSIEDELGMEKLADVYGDFDSIFIIQDIWNVQRFIKAIKHRHKPRFKMPEITVYFPIDAAKHDGSWYADLDIVKNVVTYTEFAKNEVLAVAPTLDVQVIPHGIDSHIFFKMPETIQERRQKMFKSDIFKEAFIFLNANRNQPRKRLDITMEAFALFAEGKEDVKLYMHCGPIDDSMNLYHLADRLNIKKKLMLSTNQPGLPSLTKEKMNVLNNCCDVGVNSCLGEGWGLTNIEHAITGAPQIMPAHSAPKEIFGQIEGYQDMLIPVISPYTFDYTMTVGMLVSPEDMAKKMEKIYSDKELYKTMAENTFNFFSKPLFQWETIAESWKKII